MQTAPHSLAIASGVLGGGLAASVLVLPPLLGATGDGRLPEYGAILLTLLAVHVAGRGIEALRPGSGFGARLGYPALAAVVASAIATAALLALYANWRPLLLATRFLAEAQRLGTASDAARALADLTARRVQALDAGFQAVSGGGRMLFCGLLFAGYAAFRWRVARRLGPRPA